MNKRGCPEIEINRLKIKNKICFKRCEYLQEDFIFPYSEVFRRKSWAPLKHILFFILSLLISISGQPLFTHYPKVLLLYASTISFSQTLSTSKVSFIQLKTTFTFLIFWKLPYLIETILEKLESLKKTPFYNPCKIMNALIRECFYSNRILKQRLHQKGLSVFAKEFIAINTRFDLSDDNRTH